MTTALDPNPAFDSGLQCGLFLGSLITSYVALLLWQVRDEIQGRMNRMPVNEDWPEDRQ